MDNKIPFINGSLLAGMCIALGAIGSLNLSCNIDNPSLSKLINGVAFSLGLIMIVVLQANLFTGQCLKIADHAYGKISTQSLFSDLILSYIGNLVGVLLIIFFWFHSGNISEGLALKIHNIYQYKTSLSGIKLLSSGILCNILVCSAVLMTKKSKDNVSKVIVIIFCITTFIASGYEHSIANMFYLFVDVILSQDATVLSLVKNLVLVTMGNIFGGGFIGILYQSSLPAKQRKPSKDK